MSRKSEHAKEARIELGLDDIYRIGSQNQRGIFLIHNVMDGEGYFSPLYRQNVVKASSMIPTKKVGDILREARRQSLGMGEDSCLTRSIQTAGINCWSGLLEEWVQVFKVRGYHGGSQLN